VGNTLDQLAKDAGGRNSHDGSRTLQVAANMVDKNALAQAILR
jgi:hypothetical protein